MKENLKLGFKLFTITAVAGLFLGIANELTKDVIAQNSKLNKDDLKYILPNADSIKDYGYSASEESIVKEVFEAIGENEIKGYAIKVSPKGFNGKIDMVVGIEKDGTIGGIKILSQSETPGLGAKIEEESFQNKFKGLLGKDGIKVVKNIPTTDNEIEGITGATISSSAVNTGVNEAINFYKENILGEEAKDLTIPDLSLLGLDINSNIEKLGVNLIEGIENISEVLSSGEKIGYIFEVKEVGAESDINFAVGMSIKGEITGVQILSHKETPGLGDQIEDVKFTDQFKGMNINTGQEVADVVSGSTFDVTSYGDVVHADVITGATASSMAVRKGVTNVINFYNDNLK